MNDPSELGTILSVWAHPDDETYLCAGIMSSAAQAGQRVLCVTATRGEAGSQDHERWPPDRMGSVREAELLTCLRILGVDEHRFLDYIDGTCDGVDGAEGAARVEELIRETDPDTVLTFGPEGMTDHPDHKAVHAWVTTAFARAAKPGARLLYATQTQEWKDRFYDAYQQANVFMGDTPPVTRAQDLALAFALSDDLLDRKMHAIKAHVSQVEGLFALFGEDMIRASNANESFVLGATA